jgi:hypothetical protein
LPADDRPVRVLDPGRERYLTIRDGVAVRCIETNLCVTVKAPNTRTNAKCIRGYLDSLGQCGMLTVVAWEYPLQLNAISRPATQQGDCITQVVGTSRTLFSGPHCRTPSGVVAGLWPNCRRVVMVGADSLVFAVKHVHAHIYVFS